MNIPWKELMAKAKKLDEPLTDEELELWKRGILDGNTRQCNVEWVHAVQRYIEGHDRSEVDAMLQSEIPVPPFLLPFLASKPKGRRPARFTAFEDALNLQIFELDQYWHDKTPTQMKQYLAELRGVTVRTIERSLSRARSRD